MVSTAHDCLEQIDKHLASSNQAWLFGAGISRAANIPLMMPLTARVLDLAALDTDVRVHQVLQAVMLQLCANSHIEYVLSQLGDIAAIAERSSHRTASIGSVTLTLEELRELHAKVLDWISCTIRWGYISATPGGKEIVGTFAAPVVRIDEHLSFINALFTRNQAGLAERRRAISLFTTNYDTLIEDALALNCVSYWDGFSGGAVAHRSHRYGKKEPDSGHRAHVIKLHGSIDWHLGNDGRVWRVRDGDTYPDKSIRVLIHPQSTKYLAAQRDPFASQFELLRRAIGSASENVLSVCGYSFGDEHINQEIELALQRPENKTTLLVFCATIDDVLKKWQHGLWGNRVYFITADGVYAGVDGPFFAPPGTKKHDWWTFAGVAKVLTNGIEAFIV